MFYSYMYDTALLHFFPKFIQPIRTQCMRGEVFYMKCPCRQYFIVISQWTCTDIFMSDLSLSCVESIHLRMVKLQAKVAVQTTPKFLV